MLHICKHDKKKRAPFKLALRSNTLSFLPEAPRSAHEGTCSYLESVGCSRKNGGCGESRCVPFLLPARQMTRDVYDGYTVNKIDIRLLCLVNSNLTWFWHWVDFRAYWGENLITSYIYIPEHDQYTSSAAV